MPAIDYVRVRDQRDQLGLRNLQIAERVDMTTASIENIMCGNANPSMRVVYALGRMLGISVEEIVLRDSLGKRTPNGDPSEPPNQPPNSPKAPPRREEKDTKGPRRVDGAAA